MSKIGRVSGREGCHQGGSVVAPCRDVSMTCLLARWNYRSDLILLQVVA